MPLKSQDGAALTGVTQLGSILQNERLLVRFLVRAHALVEGLVPGWGTYEGQPIDVTHINVSLRLFLRPLPSL